MPSRRLLLLAATVLGLLFALEVLCRVQPEGLAAVAHRVRFKLALLHEKGPVDFVALGTSRSNDGLSPSLLQLGTGFSAATPSSSLPTLEFQAAHLGAQKRVFVELSRPQGDPTAMDADSTPAAGSWAGDPIGEWLHQHSALLQVRRAFALENLPRVLGLLAASSLDGSEWFRSRQLVETFRPPSPPEGVADDAAWRPQRFEVPPEPPELDEDGARVLVGYERALASLKAQGARVVLVGPPVGSGLRAEECTPERNRLRHTIALRTVTPLLDFTCAEVDDRWFVDGEHLSSPGRAKYSKALGDAARALP
ncbi:MAG: hypothetical protein Q8N23_05470 [Archangium sp.]|nr:hypothetical protein [Archangium sp.]MDP3574591.1 hypothetical protein [Archangium sp.]